MATIVGTDNQDNLNGTENADEFFGRKGADNLFGLGGNDTFYWDAGKGITAPGATTIGDSDGSDVIDGGSGFDRFVALADYHYSMTGTPSVGFPTFSLTKGVDGLAHFREMQGYSGGPSGTAVSDVTLNSVEQFTFIGTKNAAPANSGSAAYTTSDIIIVGDLTGTSLAGAQLIFDLGTGGDANGAGPGNSLNAGAATNVIVAIGGSGNDALIGGSQNDQLIGNAGNDTFRGNGGTNTLIGGTGNDVYYSDNRNDTITELAGEGNDVIYTQAAYYINRANVEALVYQGSSAFTGIGTFGNETISGGDGNDYLIGLGGNDTLIAGGGANSLQGGTGDDTYYTENRSDSIIENASEGTDTVVTHVGIYVLRANVENLTFLGADEHTGYGNDADNALFGGDGVNTLYGYGGNDTLIGYGTQNTLYGGMGNDVYTIRNSTDQVIELANEGMDAVFAGGVSFTLPNNVENLYNSGGGQVTLTGNAMDNLIVGGNGADRINGLDGNDTLQGGLGNDFLSGGAGNDQLTGGLGGDELVGGGGADRFIFDMATAGNSDLVQDFSHADGDKIDVSQLLASVGYQGSDPFADGYLRSEAIPSFGSGGVAAERLLFDPDGNGPQGAFSLAVFIGSTNAFGPDDFIYGP